MKVTKITIGRVFNLGNYENARYEITAEVSAKSSARAALLGLEKIMWGLTPESKVHLPSPEELRREARRLENLRADSKLSLEDYKRNHGDFVGTIREHIRRCATAHKANVKKRQAWIERNEKARKFLDNLGGAAEWKDAKCSWDDVGEGY